MAKEILGEQSLDHLLRAVSHLVHLPKSQTWLDSDLEADVLYVHFESKPSSTHSEMQENGAIFDYKDDTLVGIIILGASQR
ncbi:MAG: hypothetical protein C4309_04875 [Chloroflexota bacterium]